MKFSKNKSYVAFMFIAFGLWVWLFRFFWTYNIGLFADGISYYYLSKKWLDNLFMGVIPYWNPFENFGLPYSINLRFIGEFNPLWIVAGIPYYFGVPYDKAYFFLLCFVYGLALVGFYLVALRFFRNQFWATLAFLMLTFSSMCMPLFFNFCIMLLALPIIWLINFMWSFYDHPHKKSFFGMVFCLMLIAITYMPFYFLIFVFIVGGLWLVLFTSNAVQFFQKIWSFCKQNLFLAIMGSIFLMMSLFPGAMWFIQSQSNEFVNVSRGIGAPSGNAAAMSIDTISSGGILGPVTLRNLFSGLDAKTESISYFLISIWAYIIVFLGMITVVNRRLILLSVGSVLLIFLVLTNATPIHKFLYDHVFFFKLIRNIFYLLYFSLPMIVLFVVEQLRLMTKMEFKGFARWGFLLFITLVHAVFIFWLVSCGDVIAVSYLTVFGSYLFFTALALGWLQPNSKLFLSLAVIILVVQPITVLHYFNQNLKIPTLAHYRTHHEVPMVTYQRNDPGKVYDTPPEYFLDKIGFEIPKNEWTGSLYPMIKNLPADVLRKYILSRFVAYDRVKYLDDQTIDWKEFGKTLFLGLNVAFVSDPKVNEQRVSDTSGFPTHARFIQESDPELKIQKFNFNEMKFQTNFKEPKFLVYNDAYHSGWRASVDGNPSKIIRANVGFKGLWIDAGSHVVDYRFGATWEHVLGWVLLIIFYGLFIYVISLNIYYRHP